MKPRKVVISSRARTDIRAMYEWIEFEAGSVPALAYIERVEEFIRSLSRAPERGRMRDDLRKGLRILGFERNLTIAIVVEPSKVRVLRVFRRGRNWEAALGADGTASPD